MAMDQSSSETIFRLPAILDLRAAVPLANALLTLRGRAISVDAADVTQIGALCLQVLLSARTTWKSDDVPLRFVTPSTPFTDAVRLFGVCFSDD